MRIFVKVIVFSLASNFIVCRTLAQQYRNFECKNANKECPTMICESHSNEKSVLPVDSFPLNTCSLTIITFGNSSLVITRADTFHKFKELQNLEIRLTRSLELVENFSYSAGKEYLNKVLFDIPKLDTLSVEYNEFNHINYSWNLPQNLEKLHLSNGIFEFDLRSCSRLTSLELNNNNLRKIPHFHYPLPPVKKLNLKNNSLNGFTVNDIAGLCELEYFAMDAVGISGCECTRLKQWIKMLREEPDFTFEGSLNCNDSVGNSKNCTLEEAMRRKEECLLVTLAGSEKNVDHFDSIIFLLAVIIICGPVYILCYLVVYFVCREIMEDPQSRAQRRTGKESWPWPMSRLRPQPSPEPGAKYRDPFDDQDDFEDPSGSQPRSAQPGGQDMNFPTQKQQRNDDYDRVEDIQRIERRSEKQTTPDRNPLPRQQQRVDDYDREDRNKHAEKQEPKLTPTLTQTRQPQPDNDYPTRQYQQVDDYVRVEKKEKQEPRTAKFQPLTYYPRQQSYDGYGSSSQQG